MFLLNIPIPHISPEVIVTSAILAMATTFAMHIKAAPGKFFSKIKNRWLYEVKIFQYDELFFMFEEWLYTHHRQTYRNVEAVVGDPQEVQGRRSYNDESDNEKDKIKYLQEGNVIILKYKGRRIMVNKNKDKIDKAQTAKDFFFRSFTISGLFARKTIDNLLQEVVKQYRERRKETKIKVYAPRDYGDWDHVTDLDYKKLDSVVLDTGLRNQIVGDLDEFVASKQWYNNLGIPYRRAYMFHGLPGNGKTSLSMAIASHLEKDIYVLQINSLSNDGALRRSFAQLGDNCILLLEDIDKAFDGREAKDHKVSFSALLNVLDGVLSKPGVITIMTTNHIEKLDPALIRSGRTDLIVEIKNPGTEEVSEYLSRFYGKSIFFKVGSSETLSMSTVQEICIRNKKDPDQAIADLAVRYDNSMTNENIAQIQAN